MSLNDATEVNKPVEYAQAATKSMSEIDMLEHETLTKYYTCLLNEANAIASAIEAEKKSI